MSADMDEAIKEARSLQWWREGYEAGRGNKSFGEDCPYTFQACGYSWEAFNRVALNKWFAGWNQARSGN